MNLTFCADPPFWRVFCYDSAAKVGGSCKEELFVV